MIPIVTGSAHRTAPDADGINGAGDTGRIGRVRRAAGVTRDTGHRSLAEADVPLVAGVTRCGPLRVGVVAHCAAGTPRPITVAARPWCARGTRRPVSVGALAVDAQRARAHVAGGRLVDGTRYALAPCSIWDRPNVARDASGRALAETDLTRAAPLAGCRAARRTVLAARAHRTRRAITHPIRARRAQLTYGPILGRALAEGAYSAG